MTKNILIADDDDAIVDALTLMLNFEGYNVSVTNNGNEILTRKAMPDLILLDIWMSGSDGREICRRLKQAPATSNVPVILISASKDIQHSALMAGADDFVEKPFDMDHLLRKVEQHLTAV